MREGPILSAVAGPVAAKRTALRVLPESGLSGEVLGSKPTFSDATLDEVERLGVFDGDRSWFAGDDTTLVRYADTRRLLVVELDGVSDDEVERCALEMVALGAANVLETPTGRVMAMIGYGPLGEGGLPGYSPLVVLDSASAASIDLSGLVDSDVRVEDEAVLIRTPRRSDALESLRLALAPAINEPRRINPYFEPELLDWVATGDFPRLAEAIGKAIEKAIEMRPTRPLDSRLTGLVAELRDRGVEI